MPDTVETVRVMPSHPSQGDWVVINKADFDPLVHTLYGQAPAEQDEQPAAKRGRPRKVTSEQDNG